MYDYESDDEEEIDEEKTDEATVAQEQILQVLTATDKQAEVAVATQSKIFCRRKKQNFFIDLIL